MAAAGVRQKWVGARSGHRGSCRTRQDAKVRLEKCRECREIGVQGSRDASRDRSWLAVTGKNILPYIRPKYKID